MKTIRIQTFFAIVLVVGFVALTFFLGPGAAAVSASERTRPLHVRKDCSQYTGLAGSSCTVAASNVAAIPVGSKVFYDQAGNNPVG
jgi:hypothetical protein